MPSANQIDARITKALVQALGVEEDEIKPTATLQGDLGAESIDFLDIVFRLEREFMIKVDRDELFPESFLTGDSGIIDGDRLTDLHLWRLGPGHLGAILSIATQTQRGPQYYQALLDRFHDLSHVTVEIEHR